MVNFEKDEAVRLSRFIKTYFKEDEVFRSKDLALLLFADKRKIKAKLKAISNHDIGGIRILRVGNSDANLWHYRKSEPR